MIRIIIVDDELLSRIGIQSFIDGKKDISVDGVFGLASEALEFLDKNQIDIVITDIEMADMNGLEFIKEIRNRNLADGIIILSCHDNFEYAREAISLGTDSYMIKHNINEKALLDEIYHVYQKISALPSRKNISVNKTAVQIEENGIYIIGVLKFLNAYSGDERPLLGGQVEETMLIHLIEGIVNQYHMGTLFAPYKKEMFIIFRFDTDTSQQERAAKVRDYVLELRRNVEQYINKSLLFGISPEFRDLREVSICYQKAVIASEFCFYDEDKYIFDSCRTDNSEIPEVNFAADNFLDEEGIGQFMEEFNSFLKKCRENSCDIKLVKQTLIQYVYALVYKVLDEYRFHEELKKKWNSKYQFIPVIMSAENIHALRINLKSVITQFQEELLDQLRKDEFTEVFQFINSNLSLKLTLSEVAAMNCMSIPSFCKKFKERTGMTLVQYINQQKIERVKTYLKNQSYSLEQIAEMTGFTNENYMIRVFKKVTGQTVKDYRSDCNDIGM